MHGLTDYMRLGHKCSSRFQECFETDAQRQLVLKAIQECQLIDKHRAQREPLRVEQSFRRDLTVTVKDALEMLVEVLDGA